MGKEFTLERGQVWRETKDGVVCDWGILGHGWKPMHIFDDGTPIGWKWAMERLTRPLKKACLECGHEEDFQDSITHPRITLWAEEYFSWGEVMLVAATLEEYEELKCKEREQESNKES